MKKILLVALGALVFFSCSKKNDSSSSSSSIVGTWYLSKDSIAVYQNGTLTDHESQTYDHTADAVFNSNGSGATHDLSNGNVTDTTKFTYTTSGTSITINTPAQVVAGESVSASSEIYIITTLTSSKLSFQSTNTETENGVTEKGFEELDFTK